MGEITYQPLRSLIYVDCVKEEYRHKLQHWLYYYHAPESIAKFEPWVTKYAFYNALPTPPQGERFGTYRMQLTDESGKSGKFTERISPDRCHDLAGNTSGKCQRGGIYGRRRSRPCFRW